MIIYKQNIKFYEKKKLPIGAQQAIFFYFLKKSFCRID